MTDKTIAESELVLNDDGSVYHLHLLPEDIGNIVFFVGDPDRVVEVSKYFDRVTVKKQKREFVTHSGFIGKRFVSVISTGIGTDNVDIVMNELDALVNIDLKTREVKEQHTSLKIIRIGTSGALQPDIPVDSVLVSEYGLGLDSLMQFYEYEEDEQTSSLLSAIDDQLDLVFVNPYLFKAPGQLVSVMDPSFLRGTTATCCGFYAPQGRMLRAETRYEDLISRLHKVNIPGHRITNFEMETAGIYGMATLLGHEAVSVNAILANRISHKFSAHPQKTVEQAILKVIEMTDLL